MTTTQPLTTTERGPVPAPHTTLHSHAASAAGSSPTATPDLALPATFEAFYALHHAQYLTYAQAHMNRTAAEGTLRATFGELATHWAHILCHLTPTAHAWDKLNRHIRSRSRLLAVDASSPLQYQVVVLHHVTGSSITDIADTTGQDPSKIRYLLHTWDPHHP
jgi:hypothetical protein